MIKAILDQVSSGRDLSMDDMARVVDHMMRGEVPEEQIAALLTALRDKGETIDEIAGAAAAMRGHMTPIRSGRSNLLDTCGTGGGGSGTFNISTAAALVAAAAGAAVAKHGNRRITSKSGSADVLAELGVNIDAPVATVQRCLEQLGICFCFAPQLHPSMKHVAAVRRQLGFRTIFNLLGPLCNPAGAPYQLLGVARPELRETLARALAKLGTQRAAVVCGDDGLGEVTLSGTTRVTLVTGQTLEETTWSPADFGLEPAEMTSLLAADPAASAAIIRDVLAGLPGPPRDVVVINAAAALWTAGVEPSLSQCARRAEQAIDSGAGSDLLARLAEASRS